MLDVKRKSKNGKSLSHNSVFSATQCSEIPKALQNRAKLNPIVKTVKKC